MGTSNLSLKLLSPFVTKALSYSVQEQQEKRKKYGGFKEAQMCHGWNDIMTVVNWFYALFPVQGLWLGLLWLDQRVIRGSRK